MSLPDYYAILGLDPNCSAAEVRTAYRRLALEHHPDRASNNKDASSQARATIRFQYINDAYSTLNDPMQRRQYDRQRQQTPPDQLFNPLEQQEPKSPGEPQSKADDVFADVFEELLSEELGAGSQSSSSTSSGIWQPVGAMSGASLGFIMANIPGAIAGK